MSTAEGHGDRDEAQARDGAAQGAGNGPVNIGSVQGAFAIGNNNQVSSQVNNVAGGPGPAQQQLLTAVKELRADLARLVPSAVRDTLDAELADAEAEIEQSGQAGPARRERLGRALAGAGAVTGFLASAATVGQALAAFAGG